MYVHLYIHKRGLIDISLLYREDFVYIYMEEHRLNLSL